MSIASNFPAISPSLSLDFAAVQALDPRITFTRASTATYYGTRTAKSEENLLVRSQEFTTVWSQEGVTRTADTNTAPDGTTTADTITETTTTSAHRVEQDVAISGTVTLSVFAKLGAGTRFLTIGVSRDVTNTASATFDLSLGTNTQTQVNGGIYSSPSATITAVAQGYFRCTLTVTTDTALIARIGLNNTGTPTSGNRAFGASYTGDGTSSLILWGAQLEQRSAVTAYTPTTDQTITNYIPVLETAASGVARFDHNPTTFESLGLLIEESRTNLVTYSEEFDLGWNKAAATITANTIVSPDGTLDADKLVEDATTAIHNTAQSVSVTSGTTYTASFYAKKAERTQCGLLFASAGFGTNTVDTFDLDAGTVITNASGTAAITAVGNDWYRVSATRTATATSSSTFQIRIGDAGSFNYLGNGYSGIYIWGAQVEAGAFATSYIPTVASQVTRAADAASMTGTNFSSWYNAAEGTFYSEANFTNTVSFNTVYCADDGNTANQIRTIQWNNGASRPILVLANGVTQASFLGTSRIGISKFSSAYKVDDFAASQDGNAVLLDASGIVPVVDRLNIGSTNLNAFFLNGTIRKLSYYPLRLSNTNLVALTS